MGEENTISQKTYGQTHATTGIYETNQKQTATIKERLLRNNQDTIFNSLYTDPECVLDLYFTLHPEDRNRKITPDQVKLITLENIFLAQRHNDIAFQVGDRLIVLVEHQSTINENMPLRMLFYVVYTGKTPWHHKELRLSEAYGTAIPEEIALEVKVRIIWEKELQNTKNTLSGYYNFVSFVKDNTINGKISIDAVENYIHQFTGSELFKRFLE